jgi:hypothetical protein
MNISIDLSQKIVESFKNQDFVLVSAKKIPGGGRIDLLGRKGEYAAVVATLPVAGAMDDAFKRIQKSLTQIFDAHGRFPERLIFQGDEQGQPVPLWFETWCEQNGIRIVLISQRTIREEWG